MFKLSFRRRKRASLTPHGARDLSEQELESMVGGTPVRHLLYPSNTPRWIRNVGNGLDSNGPGYSRYTQVFPGKNHLT